MSYGEVFKINGKDYLLEVVHGRNLYTYVAERISEDEHIEIDTTENSPEQCAQQIESILNTEPKAFRLNCLNDYWIGKIKFLYSGEIIAAFSV